MKKFIVALALLAGCKTPAEQFEISFLEACADVFKDRLRSPASFELVGAPAVSTQTFTYAFFQQETEQFSFRPTTPEEHASVKILRDAAYAKQADPDWRIATTNAQYDAENAFGVALRGSFTCVSEYKESELPTSRDDFRQVFVNGQTHMGWLTSQLAEN